MIILELFYFLMDLYLRSLLMSEVSHLLNYLNFQDMCTFYKYYSGEAIAPVLTLFIGGNHEASNYLQV